MSLLKQATFYLLLVSAAGHLSAQVPGGQIKVRESKLFGLKGERFALVELANSQRARPLTSENVNSGQYFYFVLRPAGDWTIDADFVQEDLPNLGLLQNNATLQIAWKSDILSDSAETAIVVGFPKDLKLHLPFTIRYGLDGTSSQAEVTVPQEYWPGYGVLTAKLQEAEKSLAERNIRDAITIFEILARADSLQIFPQAGDLRVRRARCFDQIIAETWSAFLDASALQTTPLKEKMSAVDQLAAPLRFVIDSLPNESLKVDVTDASVKAIIDRASDAIARIKGTRDSLQRAQDDLTVRWISEGAATGKTGPQFERIIEILAYAFSSIDIADTSAQTLTTALPANLQEVLTKNGLQESYDIFMRQANERFQKKLPPLPPGFLENLQKDSSAFSLPFYSMLKAIQDYYAGSFSYALESIHRVFRTCYEPELSRRFDQMKVIIQIRQRQDRAAIMTILEEAAAAEKAGDKESASDHYSRALRAAPDLAVAAYRCGRMFQRGGDPIRARSFFERAYEIDTMYLSAYREAWVLCQASGNFKAMVEVLTRAVNRGNDFWETNINLGIAYLGDGALPQAIKQFERALELSPNNYQTNVQLGLAYQTAKDYQKAREYYNKAIFIDPHRMEAVESLQKLDEVQKTVR